MWFLNYLPFALYPPFFSFSTMSGSPAMRGRWKPIVVLDDFVRNRAALILPGHRTIIGTRNAPSQFVFFHFGKESSRRRARYSCAGRCRLST